MPGILYSQSRMSLELTGSHQELQIYFWAKNILGCWTYTHHSAGFSQFQTLPHWTWEQPSLDPSNLLWQPHVGQTQEIDCDDSTLSQAVWSGWSQSKPKCLSSLMSSPAQGVKHQLTKLDNAVFSEHQWDSFCRRSCPTYDKLSMTTFVTRLLAHLLLCCLSFVLWLIGVINVLLGDYLCVPVSQVTPQWIVMLEHCLVSTIQCLAPNLEALPPAVQTPIPGWGATDPYQLFHSA